MTSGIGKLCRRSFVAVCLLAIITFLGGCSRFSPALLPADEPYQYEVTLPPRDGSFDFNKYTAFALSIAERWDSQARLESISRLVPCDEVDSDRNPGMLLRFYRPRRYWFGQRIEWLDVQMSDEAAAQVSILTSLNTTWNKPSVDVSALTVDYPTALKAARDQGGTVYAEDHDACYLRVVLVDNQWNFEYMEDRWGVSDDYLQFCIDGTTGKTCEFFYDDEVSR